MDKLLGLLLGLKQTLEEAPGCDGYWYGPGPALLDAAIEKTQEGIAYGFNVVADCCMIMPGTVRSLTIDMQINCLKAEELFPSDLEG
jgi:hypothetical protein